jgi:hypothetical protein
MLTTSFKARFKPFGINSIKVVVLAVDMDDRDLLTVLFFQYWVAFNKAFFDIKMQIWLERLESLNGHIAEMTTFAGIDGHKVSHTAPIP